MIVAGVGFTSFSIQGRRSSLVRPGTARLLVHLTVGLRDGVRVEDAVRVLQRIALGEVGADELGVDGAVDDDMGDMDALGPSSRAMLWASARSAVLGAGEGRKARAAAHAGGGAGEEDGAAPARHHHLAASRPIRKPAKQAISQTLV